MNDPFILIISPRNFFFSKIEFFCDFNVSFIDFKMKLGFWNAYKITS